MRSTLSGTSTASKRARFNASRDLAEVERAQAEERALHEAYRRSRDGQVHEVMDRLRASGVPEGSVTGSMITELLANLPTEESVPLASSTSLIGSMSEATMRGSWVMEPPMGERSTAAAFVPNPAVPHYRMDTPSATEQELASVEPTQVCAVISSCERQHCSDSRCFGCIWCG